MAPTSLILGLYEASPDQVTVIRRIEEEANNIKWVTLVVFFLGSVEAELSIRMCLIPASSARSLADL